MTRKEFAQAMKDFGVSIMSIKFYRTNRSKPTAEKQEQIRDKYGIPCEAWKDMRFWLEDGFKNTEVCKDCAKYKKFFSK